MLKLHALQHKIVDEIQSVYICIQTDEMIDKTKLEPMLGMYIWEGEST